MTDYFQLLNQPRLPWLDPDSLKNEFLKLTSARHPDKRGDSDAAKPAPEGKDSKQPDSSDINRAYQCLKETRTRLKHFLELTTGKPVNELSEVPSRLIELFAESNALFKRVDQAIQKQAGYSESPLLRAVQMKENGALLERIQAFQSVLSDIHADVENRLKQHNAFWEQTAGGKRIESREKEELAKLEELYRLEGYLVKWRAQLQEKLFRLAF